MYQVAVRKAVLSRAISNGERQSKATPALYHNFLAV